MYDKVFQIISEALIHQLDHDEGRGSTPNEGSQLPPVASGSVHRELEIQFPEF